MPEKPKLTLISDEKKKRDLEHVKRIRDLFKENPDLARDVLIVSSDGHVAVAPDTMTIMEIVGILQCAQHDLMFATSIEAMEEDEEDET